MKSSLRLCGFVAAMLAAVPLHAEPQVTPSERVKRNVIVRESPDPGSAKLAGLAPGQDALLEGETSGWYRVRLTDGRIGFVSKSWTIVVNPEVAETLTTGLLKVHVIDVGTGLAVFIDGPGFTMLYDGGSQDDLATGKDNRILAYIQSVHAGLQTLDHLVLSHPHKDHLELLPDVFDRLAVRHVWDSGAVNKTRGYCNFLKRVALEPSVQYHDAIGRQSLRRWRRRGRWQRRGRPRHWPPRRCHRLR